MHVHVHVCMSLKAMCAAGAICSTNVHVNNGKDKSLSCQSCELWFLLPLLCWGHYD